MAEFRGRGNNYYARSGRRVYATASNNEADAPTPDWEPRRRAWKPHVLNEAHTRNGAHAPFTPWNESKLQDADNDVVEVVRESSRQPGVHEAVCEGLENHQAVCEDLQNKGKDADDDLRRAATLLLDRTSSFLFMDLCEACSASIKHRLTSISSGKLLSKLAATRKSSDSICTACDFTLVFQLSPLMCKGGSDFKLCSQILFFQQILSNSGTLLKIAYQMESPLFFYTAEVVLKESKTYSFCIV
ncbi:hypothetical protein L7F22_014590 [Adiantum nelumboides]|nr:hypothetical protein [Adiantum nelumboides]